MSKGVRKRSAADDYCELRDSLYPPQVQQLLAHSIHSDIADISMTRRQGSITLGQDTMILRSEDSYHRTSSPQQVKGLSDAICLC